MEGTAAEPLTGKRKGQKIRAHAEIGPDLEPREMDRTSPAQTACDEISHTVAAQGSRVGEPVGRVEAYQSLATGAVSIPAGVDQKTGTRNPRGENAVKSSEALSFICDRQMY